MDDDTRKSLILAAISAHVRQRPGLDYANYGDWANYRSEMRRITGQMNDARILLDAVRNRCIGADALLDAARRAYSGRLSIVELPNGSVKIYYCAGQYFPTEYRAAACAVLGYALWEHARQDYHTGKEIHAWATRAFGRSIADRWLQ